MFGLNFIKSLIVLNIIVIKLQMLKNNFVYDCFNVIDVEILTYFTLKYPDSFINESTESPISEAPWIGGDVWLKKSTFCIFIK